MRIFGTILAMVAASTSLGAVSATPTPCPAGVTDGTYNGGDKNACYLCPLGQHASSQTGTQTTCTPCHPGQTTDFEGSKTAADCKKLAKPLRPLGEVFAGLWNQRFVRSSDLHKIGNFFLRGKSDAGASQEFRRTATPPTPFPATPIEPRAEFRRATPGSPSPGPPTPSPPAPAPVPKTGASFKLASPAPPNDNEKKNVQSNIATAAGVTSDEVNPIRFDSVQAARRRLLATYTTTVTFQVPASAITPNNLAGALVANAFTNNIASSVTGATVDTSSVVASRVCAKGTYDDGSTCTNCQAGNYGATAGLTAVACSGKCGTGATLGQYSAAGATTCTDCPAGNYGADTGTSAGHSTAICSGKCGTGATLGQYSSAAGEDKCTDCPAGNYGADTGTSAGHSAATCSGKCGTGAALGQYSLAKQAQCTDCPKGTYSTAAAGYNCENCPAGKYGPHPKQAAVISGCKNCSAGSSPEGSTAATDCTSCAAGKYTVSTNVCLECPVGKYQAAAEMTSCTACVAGKTTYVSATDPTPATAKSASTECLNCAAGRFVSQVASSDVGGDCQACPAGTYEATGQNTACTVCDSGKSTLGKAGSSAATDCKSCAAGKYKDNTADLGLEVVINGVTVPYAWAFKAGMEDCTSCAAGKFSYAEGAQSETTCLSCPAGLYSPTAGASTLTTCQDCPAGSMSVRVAATKVSDCAMCDAGKYAVYSEVGNYCEVCVAGKYAVGGSMACEVCPPGLNSPAGAEACAGCPAGSTTDSTGGGSELRTMIKMKVVSKSYDASAPQVTASLELSDKDGKAFTFSNAWVKRGFNVAWFNAGTASLNSTKNFDTYESAVESDAMLAFLMGIPAGDIVVIFVYDEASRFFGQDLKSFMAVNLFASKAFNLGFRDSYALASIKGQAMLKEGTATFAQGTGSTIETGFTGATACYTCAAGKFAAAGDESCASCPAGKYTKVGFGACELCPGGSKAKAGGTDCDACASGEFSAPGAACSKCPTGTFSNVAFNKQFKHLVATSKGWDAGLAASLTAKAWTNGDKIAHDQEVFSQAKRGFNVVTFDAASAAVKSSKTFDTYASAAESSRMLAYLTEEVATGDVVTFKVLDEASRFLGSDVKAYMATEFKAEKVASLSFRDSYALIAKKSQKAPISSFAEALAPSGAAAGARAEAIIDFEIATDAMFSSCWATPPGWVAADASATKVVQGGVSVVACDGGKYVASGGKQCEACPAGTSLSKSFVTDTVDNVQLEITGRTVADSPKISSVVVKTGSTPTDIKFDTTWVRRGFSVVAVNLDTAQVSFNKTFDTSASKVESASLLAYLKAEPVDLRTIYAFFTYEDAALNLGDDVTTYLADFFGCSKVVALGYRDVYAAATFKFGAGAKLFTPAYKVAKVVEQYSPASSNSGVFVDSTAIAYGEHYLGACISCGAGKYAEAEQSSCTNCEDGKFSATAGASACTACAVGKYSKSGVTNPASSKDSLEDCVLCTVDAYLGAAGAEDITLKNAKACDMCSPGYATMPNSSPSDFSIAVTAVSKTSDSGNVADLVIDGLGMKSGSLKRGFNVVTLDADTGFAAKLKHFDTSVFSSDSASMLTYIKTIADGTLTAFIVLEEANGKLGEDVKSYLVAYFGARLVAGLSARAGYALIAKKGQTSFVEGISMFNDPAGVSAKATISFKRACSKCFVGHYSPGGTTANMLKCIQCEAGQYANMKAEAATACLKCSAGQSSGRAADECTACPAGYYTEPGGSICLGCAPGKFRQSATSGELLSVTVTSTGFGGFGASSLELAVLDFTNGFPALVPQAFSNDWVGRGFNVVQMDLSTGTIISFKNFDTHDDLKTASADMLAYMKAMPADTVASFFVDDEGSKALSADVVAYLAANFGATQAGNLVGNLGFRSTYALIAMKGQTTALKEDWAAAGSAAGVVIETFLRVVPSGLCKDCAPAKYSPKDAAECKACAAGTYASTVGTPDVCPKCATGKYSALAATACTACAAGKDQGAVGQSSCISCVAGKFAATAGIDACVSCAKGTYSALPGATLCRMCAAGQDQSSAAGTSCTACAKGKYASGFGSIDCTFCPIGYYQPIVGAVDCNYCGDGFKTLTMGSDGANDCVAVRRRLRAKE